MFNKHLSPFYQKLNRHHLSTIELKKLIGQWEEYAQRASLPFLQKMEQVI